MLLAPVPSQAQRFFVLRTLARRASSLRALRFAARHAAQFGETSLFPHRGLGWVTGRHGHLGSWLHLRSLCESHQTTPGAAAVVAVAHRTATTVGSARPCYALSMGARLPPTTRRWRESSWTVDAAAPHPACPAASACSHLVMAGRLLFIYTPNFHTVPTTGTTTHPTECPLGRRVVLDASV